MANLLTLDEFKLLEGINSTQNDDKFEQLLTGVSTLVRNYTGQTFDTYIGSPGKTELFDIQWDSHAVQLEETPVIEITGVSKEKLKERLILNSFGTEQTVNMSGTLTLLPNL